MPYLKKVTINNNDYFYLFHTVRDGKKYRKLSKYIGKDMPAHVELERIKKEFLADMKNKPVEEEKTKVNVIEILQDLQEREGYLSKESMIKLSKEFDVPGVKIYGVATFYSMFRLTKSGKHKIAICTGTACHVKDSGKLLTYLEELLGIKKGETTSDCKFTLEGVNCIGACAKAPAMMIDDIVYGELDKKQIKEIIGSLK